jgi:hypothetical protein
MDRIVRPAPRPLLANREDRSIKEVARDSILRTVVDIGHTFTKATRKTLQISTEGFLLPEEERSIHDTLEQHGIR